MVRLNDLILKRDELKRIAASHGARNLAVFGSVARGENTDASDIDFLIDLDPGRSLLDRIGLKHDLEDFLGHPVDVINRRSIHSAIRQRVLQDRVEL